MLSRRGRRISRPVYRAAPSPPACEAWGDITRTGTHHHSHLAPNSAFCTGVESSQRLLRDLAHRTGKRSLPPGCRQLFAGEQRARRILRPSRRDLCVPAIPIHRRPHDHRRRIEALASSSRPCVGRCCILRTREKMSGPAAKSPRASSQHPYVPLACLAPESVSTATRRSISPTNTPTACESRIRIFALASRVLYCSQLVVPAHFNVNTLL